jgi:hypothetical protein
MTISTRFAPVAPIQVLEGLWAAGPEVFGNYHLLLAHHTVEHPKRFADLFRAIEDKGTSVDVIMDNSIVELGDAVSIEMVAEAVNIIQENAPNSNCYPVLVDVMGDGLATREAIRKNYLDWVEGCGGDGFMAVCQGKDLDDYEESVAMFSDRVAYPNIKILGIPRVLVNTCGSRLPAVEMVKKHRKTHLIHMLGFSDDMQDDLAALKDLGCGGIDSAVPLRMREIFTLYSDAGKRPPSWFDNAQVDGMMLANLQEARNMFDNP